MERMLFTQIITDYNQMLNTWITFPQATREISLCWSLLESGCISLSLDDRSKRECAQTSFLQTSDNLTVATYCMHL